MIRTLFSICLMTLASAQALAGEAAGSATPAPVPFGPGELLTYEVRLGPFTVGESSMWIPDIETTRGMPTYRIEWRIKGGIPFYHVDTTFKSWVDVNRLVSLRFVQDQHEGSNTRYRDYLIFPEQRRWTQADGGDKGALPSADPLDDLSFVYFARTLDMKVGKSYRFDRYFKESGNPVIIKVLRRDTRTVPAGTFRTIVLQPIIRTSGMFSEGGRAELHFSDDARRILVYMKTELPGINLTLHLKSVRDGTPIHGGAVIRAEIRSAPPPVRPPETPTP